jgi:hypothetical protein
MALHLTTIPVLRHAVQLTELVPRLSVKPNLAELTAAQKACFDPLNAKLLRLEQQILQDAVALYRRIAANCTFDLDDLHYDATVSFHLHEEDKYFSDDSDNTLCLMNIDFAVENKQNWPLSELKLQMQLDSALTLHNDSAQLLCPDELNIHYALAQPPHSVLLHYLLKEVITYRNADNPGSLGLLDLLRIGTVWYELNPRLCLTAPLQLSYPQSLHQFADKVTPYQPSELPRKNHAAFKARDEAAHG